MHLLYYSNIHRNKLFTMSVYYVEKIHRIILKAPCLFQAIHMFVFYFLFIVKSSYQKYVCEFDKLIQATVWTCVNLHTAFVKTDTAHQVSKTMPLIHMTNQKWPCKIYSLCHTSQMILFIIFLGKKNVGEGRHLRK